MRREKGGQLRGCFHNSRETMSSLASENWTKEEGNRAKTGTLGINNKWGWRWGKLISSGDYWRGRRRTKENSYQRQERLSRTDKSQRNRIQWVRTEESPEVIGDLRQSIFPGEWSQIREVLRSEWGGEGSGIFHQDRDGGDHGGRWKDVRVLWGMEGN